MGGFFSRHIVLQVLRDIVTCIGFTGIDQEYEHPSHPELILKAGEQSVDECVQQLVHLLVTRVSHDYNTDTCEWLYILGTVGYLGLPLLVTEASLSQDRACVEQFTVYCESAYGLYTMQPVVYNRLINDFNVFDSRRPIVFTLTAGCTTGWTTGCKV